MLTNKQFISKYSFNSGPLIKYLNSIKLKYFSFITIEIVSGKIFQKFSEFVSTSATEGNILIKFWEFKSNKEIVTVFNFRGITIMDDLKTTLDVSTFELNLAPATDKESIYILDIPQNKIKEIGVYHLSIKNIEFEIDIDTALYFELEDDNYLIFEDVHDRKCDEFYYIRREEMNKLDILKTFYYDESRFIEWEKKCIIRF